MCDILILTNHTKCVIKIKKGVQTMNKLAKFREEKGLSLEQMASKVGVSKSFYEKIEYQERNPSYRFISLFLKAFPNAKVKDIFFTNQSHETCIKNEH